MASVFVLFLRVGVCVRFHVFVCGVCDLLCDVVWCFGGVLECAVLLFCLICAFCE